MRNWLAWIVGFALCFSLAFGLLLVAALSRPSLYLPAAFGFAFYGVLSFSRRLDPRTRTGLAILFGSGSCLVWLISGGPELDQGSRAFLMALEMILVVFALAGAVTVAASLAKPSKAGVALWPALSLMFCGWLISYFSSTHGGATPMVEWVMRHFHLGRHAAEIAVIAFRKTVHVTFYGLVTLLGLATAARNGAVGKACVVAALLTTLAYASFDELRQSSQPDRTGSAWDVLLDLAGGSAALGAVYALRTTKPADRPKAIQKSSTL